MKLYVGTSGYSYKEWKGNFYPERISAKEMLAYYANELPTVEINNTFYRMPRANVVTGWSEQVPETFRFVLKATRRITHLKRLEDADDELRYLLEVTAGLGERLGAHLFQLPPFFKKDVERLRSFLDLLPPGTPAAFEFRQAGWFDDEVAELLRDHGCALAHVDAKDGKGEPARPIVRTADWGYLRLRRPEYADQELERIAAEVADQGWSHVFVFFKHEDDGAGPALARRFREVVGVE